MIPAQQITTACWAVFLLYWLISARSVKPTDERPGGIGGYWHYLLAAFAFVLLQNIPVYPLTLVLLPHSLLTNILSSVFAIGGLGIAVVARHTLAEKLERCSHL